LAGKGASAGGLDELFRLPAGERDYVLNVAETLTDEAALEFPAAVAKLRSQLFLVDSPIGIIDHALRVDAELTTWFQSHL
jgi:hypothetical protein